MWYRKYIGTYKSLILCFQFLGTKELAQALREKKQPLVILMLVLLQHGTLFSLSKYFKLLWEWILFFHFNIREIVASIIKFICYFLLIYFFLFFSLNFDRDGSSFKAYTSNLFILFFSYKVLFSHHPQSHNTSSVNLWFFLGCPTNWLIYVEYSNWTVGVVLNL